MKKKVEATWVLKQLREKGCSYEEIAYRTGKSFNTIYRWAKGVASPSFGDSELIRAFAVSKGITVEEREEIT